MKLYDPDKRRLLKPPGLKGAVADSWPLIPAEQAVHLIESEGCPVNEVWGWAAAIGHFRNAALTLHRELGEAPAYTSEEPLRSPAAVWIMSGKDDPELLIEIRILGAPLRLEVDMTPNSPHRLDVGFQNFAELWELNYVKSTIRRH